VCEFCWADIKSADKAEADEDDEEEQKIPEVEQPQGTISRYNEFFYCEVQKMKVAPHTADEGVDIQVTINVRGDGTSPLQTPEGSRFIVDGKAVNVTPKVAYMSRDAYQILAVLTYQVTDESILNDLGTKLVEFKYGSAGYKPVRVFVPGSLYRADMAPTDEAGHKTVISNYSEGNYATGFVCNICNKSGLGERWFCQDCSADFCFNCNPAGVVYPNCANGHAMTRFTKMPPDYNDKTRVNCDECKARSIHLNYEFYHCTEGCRYDLCISCAAAKDQAEFDDADDDQE
jgi:hypothetical protein